MISKILYFLFIFINNILTSIFYILFYQILWFYFGTNQFCILHFLSVLLRYGHPSSSLPLFPSFLEEKRTYLWIYLYLPTYPTLLSDIDLEQFSLVGGLASPQLGFEWGVFQFVFQFSYQICGMYFHNQNHIDNDSSTTTIYTFVYIYTLTLLWLLLIQYSKQLAKSLRGWCYNYLDVR